MSADVKHPSSAALTAVRCPACGRQAACVEVVQQTAAGPRLEFFKCEAEGCTGGRLAVVFELAGGLAAAEPGYVETAIARRGAFFPADGQPGFRSGRRW